MTKHTTVRRWVTVSNWERKSTWWALPHLFPPPGRRAWLHTVTGGEEVTACSMLSLSPTSLGNTGSEGRRRNITFSPLLRHSSSYHHLVQWHQKASVLFSDEFFTLTGWRQNPLSYFPMCFTLGGDTEVFSLFIFQWILHFQQWHQRLLFCFAMNSSLWAVTSKSFVVFSEEVFTFSSSIEVFCFILRWISPWEVTAKFLINFPTNVTLNRIKKREAFV